MRTGGDLTMIKSELQARCVNVCRALLPHGRKEGSLYVAHDPVQGDYERKPALKVRLSGNIGGWESFRGGAEGARHDILGLVEYINRTDTKGALVWARDFLGLRNMSREERAAMQKAATVRIEKAEKRDRENRQWKIDKARQLFEQNTQPIHRARHALEYFKGRNIPLEEIETLNDVSMRFCPSSHYWSGAEYRTEANGRRVKLKDGPYYPAIHSAIRGPHGQVTACHVTFLDPLRPVKAPVENAKLMYGEVAGGVIEVATGPTCQSYWTTTESGVVIVCEGIETALSLALSVPEARVWAATSIVNMGNAPVWLDCASSIVLARDNNDGNATAQRQIELVIDRLEQAGKPLKIIKSMLGDDFNDLMKGTE